MGLLILGYDFSICNKQSYGGKVTGIAWLSENHYNVPRGCIIPASNSICTQEDIALLIHYTNAHGPWILRSSADNEDGKMASFAGLYQSSIIYDFDIINDVLLHLRQRAYSEDLFQYARNKNIILGKLHFLFQEYIIGNISGVFFSDLFGKGPVIEYVQGTCNGLVDGDIDAKRIWWNHLDKQDSSQQEMVSIFQKCLKIKESLQQDIDIEWTIRNNLLYFLQVRPITTRHYLDR